MGNAHEREKRRTSTAVAPAANARPEWKGFCDIPLTSEQKDRVRELSSDPVDCLGIIGDFVSNGYRFTASRDTRGGGFVSSVTPTQPSDPNAGFTLTGRGGSLERAINALYYKHVVIAQEGLWTNFSGGFANDDVG